MTETLKPEDSYAVREGSPHEKVGYAVINPATGQVESNKGLVNGYCEQPLTMPLNEAQHLADKLTASSQTGTVWSVELAPHPCPNCKREIWANDRDFCYPQNRERTQWVAGCFVHNFGCGFKLHTDSKEEALAAWNTPLANPTGARIWTDETEV
jgi:hypothetical protein